MTEKGLKRNHKSYCTWHHRKWTVHRYAALFPAEARRVLARELGLCGKLLDLDDRNFHCWGYRRRAPQAPPKRNARPSPESTSCAQFVWSNLPCSASSGAAQHERHGWRRRAQVAARLCL